MTKKNNETGLEIAVIGMAGMFPGAPGIGQFWENLKNGVESISFFSLEEMVEAGINAGMIEDPAYVPAYGILENKEVFDASFFGYSPREAEAMDPNIRLFHQVCWEALDDAGYDPFSYPGSIGVYAGSSTGMDWQLYLLVKSLKGEDADRSAGSHMTDNPLLLSTRISHKLNLKGPSVTMFTACSTSLVTVHTACRALLTGECDMALAGGASIIPTSKNGYVYQEGMILSSDGHCRTFDARSGGTVFGEGVGVVVLKRLRAALKEGDDIRCVIKASAVNNDGSGKSSYTAPGKRRIADVVRAGLKLARVTPDSIGYIENHGTATDMGDAIEIEALKDAFDTPERSFCGLGSVKSNIGHLDVAAGVAGLIKTVLSLQHRIIPPTLHFYSPNPKIDFLDSPFYINTHATPWEKGASPRRAGVCSFGIGGTNAFTLLEEAPPLPERDKSKPAVLPYLLLLSARTSTALDRVTLNLVEHLEKHPGIHLGDAAYTLQAGRRAFRFRRMVIGTGRDEVLRALRDAVGTEPGSPAPEPLPAGEVQALIRRLLGALENDEPGLEHTVADLGNGWIQGGKIDWRELYAQLEPYSGTIPRRVALPVYPFEGQPFKLADGELRFDAGIMKETSPLERQSMDEWFYIPSWERVPVSTGGKKTGNEDGNEDRAPGVWLVFKGEPGAGPLLEQSLSRRLRGNGQTVVTVTAGTACGFTRTGDNDYMLDPSRQEDYTELFQSLSLAGKLPARIILFQGEEKHTNGNGTGAANAAPCPGRAIGSTGTVPAGGSFWGLLRLVRAWGRLGVEALVRVIVVASGLFEVTGDEGALNPLGAAVLGAVKGIPLEYPHVECCCVDMGSLGIGERREQRAELYARLLLSECAAGVPGQVVAYRGRYRWVQTFKPVSLPVPGDEVPWLREGGVYLITGGFGGMGMTFARFLAERGRARIVLTGSSPFPGVGEWNQWLDTHDRDDPVCVKIKEFRRWEALGARVLAVTADAAGLDAMTGLFQRIEEHFGPVEGVFHAAGVMDTAGIIQRRSDEETLAVMSPKVGGTLVLDQIFRKRVGAGEPVPGFLVLCSSMATVTYGSRSGQVGYLAAGEFLDAFPYTRSAEALEGNSPVNTITVNWAGWLETGMAVRALRRRLGAGAADINFEELLDDYLSPSEGIEVLNRILSNPRFPRILIATRPLEALRERINTPVHDYRDQGISGQKAGGETALYQRPGLSTGYVAPAGETEEVLAGIWRRFFGIREVGIHDDFFELGGDSLKAITVLTEIHKQLETRMPIVQLFQTPTIADLAAYIDAAGTEEFLSIPVAEAKEYYPLSSVQRRLYILQQFEPGSTAYNNPLIFTLKGLLDIPRLEGAFQRLLDRHESLRTAFRLLPGEHVQFIRAGLGFRLEGYESSFSAGNAGHRKDSGIERAVVSFVRPFDLAEPPLIRAGLVCTGENEHVLMVDMHHVVTDGTSIGLMTREFMIFYDGGGLEPLTVQYKDFAAWQASDTQQQEMKRQETFWLEQLSGELPVLTLPTDFPRPAVQSFEGRRHRFTFSPGMEAALRKLARNEGVTLFMLLLAFYNMLLSRLSGQEDIIVGSPIAARRHVDLQKIIGMLVNTLTLRNYPVSGKTFRRFLGEIKDNTLSAFENQDYLFEDLVDQVTLEVHRDVSRNPVFDAMFVLQNFQSQYEAAPEVGGGDLVLEPYGFERGIAIFDLSFETIDNPGDLSCSFEYCTRLFKPGTIERFTGYLNRLIEGVLESPELSLFEYDMMPEEERMSVLRYSNGGELQYEAGEPVHVLFRRRVELGPDRTSLVYGDSILTYGELNRRAGFLASRLREQGVGPDVVVGVLATRSLEMIIALLAVLKAGGAYLPIDPAYPETRKRYMAVDSGTPLILTNLGGRLPDYLPGGVEVMDIDKIIASCPGGGVADPFFENDPGRLVYVVYTSGSTGTPKGVMLQQGNVLNLLHHQYLHTSIDFSRVLQFTTICFDVSFQEIFSTLPAGGTLVLVPDKTVKDIPLLFGVIRRQCIPTLFLPAAFLKFAFSDAAYASVFPRGVKHIVSAGEQLVVTGRFRDYLRANGVSLHNHYGPAETHVVTAATFGPGGEIPSLPHIGKPLGNTQIYILSKDRRLQPMGVPGELFIGGIQVGRGYLNQPELTAERFAAPWKSPQSGVQGAPVTDGFYYPLGLPGGPSESPRRAAGGSLYCTGDLARWLSDGSIECLGRVDQQVKVRGYRIEPGEVERRIVDVEGVKEAAVVVREDAAGEKFLCAFVVPVGTGDDVLPAVRVVLGRDLPDYMVPSRFVVLEALPYLPNGKVNMRELRRVVVEEEVVAPITGGEELRMARLWGEVLGMEPGRIGADHNFFRLGGHSLKANLLIARIHKEMGIRVPMAEIFKSPTLRGLVDVVRRSAGPVESYAGIAVAEEREYYPLSAAQERLYIIQQMDLSSTAYNMPSALRLEGEVDFDRLEKVFRQLIDRHEAFRTAFITVNEEPVQVIHDHVDFSFQYIPLSEASIPTAPAPDSSSLPTTYHLLPTVFSPSPFDLSRAPLLRVTVAGPRGGAASSPSSPSSPFFLFMDIHHIVSDGMSSRVFSREFMELYSGGDLPPLGLRYRDYALWQRSDEHREMLVRQQAFWMEMFSGDIPVLDLAGDYPRPAVQRFEGTTFDFSLDEALTGGLNGVALERGVSLYMLLISLFNLVLSRFSGKEDIVVGTPVAGRGHTELEPLIGMFVNTLALRNFPVLELPFDEFLLDVKERTLRVFENQDVQFEDLVDRLALRRDASRSPLFDVMFGLVNITNPSVDGPGEEDTGEVSPGVRVFEQPFEKTVSRFDMTWNASEQEGELKIEVEYATALFKEQTIRRFALAFEQAAAAVTQSPAPRLGEIDILPEEEKQRLLTGFNAAPREYPGDKTIPQLFYRQVERLPHAVAVVDGERMVTFRQLAYRVGRLAALLRRESPVPGIVALMAERSLELITGMLGIICAGCAYVPLNPKAPPERNRYILEDSNASILLRHSMDRGYAGRSYEIPEPLRVIELREVIEGSGGLDGPKPLRAGGHDLAYIIYTSGSTGEPKGVPIDHANLCPLMFWGYHHLSLQPGGRAMQNLAYFFDGSLWEILIVLTSGASLYMFPGEVLLNPELCIREIQVKGITILHVTPSQYRYYLDTGRRLDGLQYLFLCAETLTFNVLERSFSSVSKDCRVFNVYGPTEVTIISAVLEASRQDRKRYEHLGSIPIGGPVANLMLLILDRLGGLSPLGVPGELYIGGPGVARGYLNNPELTAEKFAVLPSAVSGSKNLGSHIGLPVHPESFPGVPFSPLYKTGDLVRWLDDGVIEFLGRMDQQVKVRGFRIELGEIEKHILEHPGVKGAVVVTREPRPGDPVLCAYIIPGGGDTGDAELPAQLRVFLGRRLPDYMVPLHFISLEHIPLTPNGKVDFRALPAPGIDEDGGFLPPSGPEEEALAGIWADVLGMDREKISAAADFFRLGGHSLKATVMTARVHKRLGVHLPLTEIFRVPVLRDLARLIRDGRGGEKKLFQAIESAEEKEFYPLSSAQKRIFVLQKMEAESIAYNIPSIECLAPAEGEPPFEPEKLEQVFRQLIQRHESFRTTFHIIDGEPVQVIHDRAGFNIEYVSPPETSTATASAPHGGSNSFSLPTTYHLLPTSFISTPFDLTRAPLLRVVLSVPQGGAAASSPLFLFIDMHHIISDGTSVEVLTREFLSLYRGEPLGPVPLRYRDYAQWQHREDVIAGLNAQESYWLEQYSGEVPVLELPTDLSRPAVQSFEGNTLLYTFGVEESAALVELAREQDCTVFMLLSAIFNVFLARLSGREDIMFGTPVAARRHADLEHVIGMFVNTLVLRNFPHRRQAFTVFLEKLKTRTLEAFENQEYPFEELVERLDIRRDAGRNPLFDVMFSLDSSQVKPGGGGGNGGEQEELRLDYRISKFDLTLSVTQSPEELFLSFEYAVRLFREDTMRRWMGYFRRIALAAAARPGELLQRIDMMGEEEKQQVLYGFNRTHVDFTTPETFPEWFLRQVTRTPHRPALQYGELQVTYEELNRGAERLALKLRDRGVGPGSITGILVERSVDMFVGFIGVLKAGGAYLPLDPGFPPERFRYILKDSGINVLLAGRGLEVPAESGFSGQLIRLDRDVTPAGGKDTVEPLHAPADPAYVIYTSGTTGRPKGVVVTHGNAVAYLRAFLREFPLGMEDVVIQSASFVFDAFVEDAYIPLVKGAKICIAQKFEAMDARLLAELSLKNRVTFLSISPLLANEFNRLKGLEQTPIRYILSGGDILKWEYADRLLKAGKAVYNVYGPTEATVVSTCYPVPSGPPPGPSIPIGKPIPGYRVYLLDPDGSPQPIGIPGEICIAGNGVAPGYLNNPELTAERFVYLEGRWEKGEGSEKEETLDAQEVVMHPDGAKAYNGAVRPGRAVGSPRRGAGGTFYLTGDLGRWLPDGNIEFLGRIDRQVKIRGFRIELGEIEARLMRNHRVKEAVVIARDDEQHNKSLCAYIVPEGEKTTAAGLKEFLSRQVPAYMVPAFFVFLDTLPLTVTGKVDKPALPAPGAEGDVYVAPAGQLEEVLARLWARVLGVEAGKISVESNFFDLGGHSLKATLLTGLIHKELGVDIPLVDFFNTPTLRGLAAYIYETGGGGETFAALAPVEEKEYYPLSSAQKRLYILQQMESGNTAYNMPEVMLLSPCNNERLALEPGKIEQVFRQLIDRHESFRTSFHTIGGQPVQVIHQEVDFNIERIPFPEDGTTGKHRASLGGHMGPPLQPYVAPGILQEGIDILSPAPFDLSRAPLLRVILAGPQGGAAASSPFFLFIDMHHIISDGMSMEILTNQFQALYRGEQCPPLQLRYRDYASWQNREIELGALKTQESWWMWQLSAPRPRLDLPLDFSRPAVRDFNGGNFDFLVEEEETSGLNALALDAGASLFMLSASIFNLLLSRLSGTEDIITGTPVAGRHHAEVQDIIGVFVNTLALRIKPVGETGFNLFFRDVKERTLAAFQNQDYPFDALVEKLSLERDAARNPLFDVMLSYYTGSENVRPAPDVDAGGTGHDEFLPAVAKFDLTLSIEETGGRLRCSFQYARALFKPGTMERFSHYFLRIADAVLQDPARRLAGIDILPERERRRLLVDFNRSGEDYPRDTTIHGLFHRRAEVCPDAPAVVDGERTVTYRVLSCRAARLGAVLRMEHGAGPVAIMADRSLELIIGILGILSAGYAYVPLNPGAPAERNNYILRDSNVSVLLHHSTAQELDRRLDGLPESLRIIELRGAPDEGRQFDAAGILGDSNDWAYIIYTSGTTGHPKGVPITHANFSQLVHWGDRHLDIGPSDRVLQNLSYYFDWSVWEIFITLAGGASLYMIPEEKQLNPGAGIGFIRAYGLTVLHVTPAQWSYYVDTGRKLETLRYLFIGAEKLTLDLARRSFGAVGSTCAVYNMYGPTEATIIASALEISREFEPLYRHLGSIPIGRPVGNLSLYVLDRHQNPCPTGVTGELYIGGTGVSRGYLNSPQLTAERFIEAGAWMPETGKTVSQKLHAAPKPPQSGVQGEPPPGAPRAGAAGGIFYRTGDLARWLEDGTVEFIGRVDEQVKIRGFRIEPGEIESRLLMHPDVKDTVVAVRDDKQGNKYLCAYIVPVETGKWDEPGLKEFLARQLPGYMVPAFFARLETLPLTSSGKIDKTALPEPDAAGEYAYAPPANRVEEHLVRLWAEVLELEPGKIGADRGFFALGGHSLIAAVMLEKVREELGVTIPLTRIFQVPTIRGLAQYIEQHTGQAPGEIQRQSIFKGGGENLVLLRRHSDRAKNMFFFHAGSGDAEVYVELGARLDMDFNLWGLKATPLENYMPRNETLETIVQRYLEQIRALQPSGPYFLAGWCVGGSVAFEAARQLEKGGETVHYLGIIDSPVPDEAYRKTIQPLTPKVLSAWLESMFPVEEAKKRIMGLPTIEETWAAFVSYLDELQRDTAMVTAMKQAIPARYSDPIPNFEEQDLKGVFYYLCMLETNGAARDRYRPGAAIEGHMHFIQAAEPQFQSDLVPPEGWSGLAAGTFTFSPVYGSHYPLLRPPRVDDVSRAMAKELVPYNGDT